MKHLTPTDSVMRHVLQRARTIAIIGASPSPERHSHAVTRYLAHEGYDVIPVRPDQSDVAGLAGHPNATTFTACRLRHQAQFVFPRN